MGKKVREASHVDAFSLIRELGQARLYNIDVNYVT